MDRVERLDAERRALEGKWNAMVAETRAKGRASQADVEEHRSLRQQIDRLSAEIVTAMNEDGYRAQRAEVDADLEFVDRSSAFYRKAFGPDREVRRPDWLNRQGRPAPAAMLSDEYRVFELPLGPMFAGKRNRPDGFIDHGGHEVRDLFTSTSGAPVPTEMAQSIYSRLIDSSAVLASNVRVVTTDGGWTFNMPRFDSFGTAEITAEGTAAPEVDPGMAHTTLGAFGYKAFVQASTEFLQDSVTQVEPFIADALAKSIDLAVGPHLALGTGTTQPLGVFNQPTTNIHTGGTAVGGTATASDLIATFFALPSYYRPRAEWIMSDSVMSSVARLTDSNGQFLLQPAIAEGYPDRLCGRPVRTDAYCPSYAADGTAIMFGDWSRASVVRFAGPMRVDRSDSLAFAEFVVSWRSILRMDLQQLDASAMAAYVGGGTA